MTYPLEFTVLYGVDEDYGISADQRYSLLDPLIIHHKRRLSHP